MKTTDSPHGLNGQAGEPVKKKRSRKKATVPAGPSTPAAQVEPVKELFGRCAGNVPIETVTYLCKPWIPYKELCLVSGQPKTGKSTFAAWLIKQAVCAAIMPGYEESVTALTLPRLKAMEVNLSDVLLLDDRDYRLPRDKARVAEAITSWGAQLLVLDPVDSYMEDDRSENSGQDVRPFLESLAWIAQTANVAVVGIRHVGKDLRNIMPGSRAWRAVPRSVLHLVMDSSDPPKRYIIHASDSHGNDAPPHRYTLDGQAGKPRRFRLMGEIASSNLSLGQEVQDPTERIDVRRAGRYVRRLFDLSPEPLVEDWKKECLANGVSDRARREAYRLLRLDEKPGSVGGKWIIIRLAKEWPPWTDDKDSSM